MKRTFSSYIGCTLDVCIDMLKKFKYEDDSINVISYNIIPYERKGIFKKQVISYTLVVEKEWRKYDYERGCYFD